MTPEVVLATKKNSCSGREERREVTSGVEGKMCTCEGREREGRREGGMKRVGGRDEEGGRKGVRRRGRGEKGRGGRKGGRKAHVNFQSYMSQVYLHYTPSQYSPHPYLGYKKEIHYEYLEVICEQQEDLGMGVVHSGE